MKALINDQEERLEDGALQSGGLDDSATGVGESWAEESDWEDEWDDLEERMAENLAYVKKQNARERLQAAAELEGSPRQALTEPEKDVGRALAEPEGAARQALAEPEEAAGRDASESESGAGSLKPERQAPEAVGRAARGRRRRARWPLAGFRKRRRPSAGKETPRQEQESRKPQEKDNWSLEEDFNDRGEGLETRFWLNDDDEDEFEEDFQDQEPEAEQNPEETSAGAAAGGAEEAESEQQPNGSGGLTEKKLRENGSPETGEESPAEAETASAAEMGDASAAEMEAASAASEDASDAGLKGAFAASEDASDAEPEDISAASDTADEAASGEELEEDAFGGLEENRREPKQPKERKSLRERAAQAKELALALKKKVQDWYEGTAYVEEGQDELSSYKRRIWLNRRKMIIRRSAIAAGVLLAFLIGKTVIDHWHYSSYEVLALIGKEGVSSQYLELEGNLLRYSADGVSLLDGKETTLWTDTYDMTSPAVDICEGTAAVYDQRGSQISIYNADGRLGRISTEYPILKVRVTEQGVVAAMLEDGENTWLNVYSASGDKLVASKTRVDSPGYPISFDLSDNGMLMAVSYLYVEGGSSTTRLVFYNFGSVGQNQTDNIVKQAEYPDHLIPQVEFLGNETALAFRDDGFSVYTGAQIPDESENVEVEGEIISTFSDENYIGMILHSQEEDARYTMRVYKPNGKLKFEEDFDVEYSTVRISGDNILLYNDTQLCVYSMKGVERFNGNIEEGSIQDVFKIDANRYIAVLSTGICTFKLK